MGKMGIQVICFTVEIQNGGLASGVPTCPCGWLTEPGGSSYNGVRGALLSGSSLCLPSIPTPCHSAPRPSSAIESRQGTVAWDSPCAPPLGSPKTILSFLPTWDSQKLNKYCVCRYRRMWFRGAIWEGCGVPDKGSDLGLFSLPWHSLANVWRALNGTPEPVSLDPRRNPESRERCWAGTKHHLSGTISLMLMSHG